uniref:Uncharacterized protein n=1 Tax=Mus musculus TaxID=10090 RepID=Q8BMI2_MOUSE|nr:unnamed protein product [Mus musculus]
MIASSLSDFFSQTFGGCFCGSFVKRLSCSFPPFSFSNAYLPGIGSSPGQPRGRFGAPGAGRGKGRSPAEWGRGGAREEGRREWVRRRPQDPRGADGRSGAEPVSVRGAGEPIRPCSSAGESQRE